MIVSLDRTTRQSLSGNPRDLWPAWTDEERWVPSTSEEVPSAPTEVPPRPSPDVEASAVGYDRGYEHDAFAIPPSDALESEISGWWMGFNLGWLRRESDDYLINRLAANHEIDPIVGIHECEMVEAGYRFGPDLRSED